MPKIKEELEMNKILIVCGGKEIVIKTKSTVEGIADFIKMNREDEFIKINSNTVISPYDVTLIKDITSEPQSTLTLDGEKIASVPTYKLKMSTPNMCCVGCKKVVKPLGESKSLEELAKAVGGHIELKGCISQNGDMFLARLIYEEPADSSGEYFNCCVVKRVENNRGVLFDGREIEIDKLRIKRIEGSVIFLCEV